LRPEFLAHEVLKTGFFNEARIIASVEHPNLRRIYDVDRDKNGVPFQVLEYVDGVTLAKYINEDSGKVPLPNAITLIQCLAMTLELVHARGVCHRDLKPENIIFDPNPCFGPTR